ncbi:uncharacterized protein [Elaeis guineensis]|uniref:Proline-rich receptor-like protein kinase PERK2 isoform X2 n=1 Tax=Elaeis guineensis var. tenera TaxID=51953 RepID=A0A6J0PE64_ELAGV|nr:proline-rich receptor-like protein kinase PERK2 isoform X2 [Elaeis guineensis]
MAASPPSPLTDRPLRMQTGISPSPPPPSAILFAPPLTDRPPDAGRRGPSHSAHPPFAAALLSPSAFEHLLPCAGRRCSSSPSRCCSNLCHRSCGCCIYNPSFRCSSIFFAA